ncbi:MAG: hypothetical protein PHH08_03070 [Candidatus ainarchaeum sp.]|nr:hypothetical protein [Candidatus ainarchaeum sp.]
MFFNKKGQAFDVFKLLIAAIIAIAILALLMPILTGIGGGFGSKPSEEAQTALKSIANKPTTSYTTKKVVFGPSTETSINSKSIAEGSNGLVSAEQVCVSQGDYVDDTANWETSSEMAVVKYKASSAKTVTLQVICDRAQDMQEGDSYFEKYDDKLRIDGVDWASECPCIAAGGSETCCVLAVKKV